MITAVQIRMARAALDWTVRDLAEKAEVAPTTVNRIERGRAAPNRSTLAVLRRALEAGGVEFLDDDGVRIVRENA